MNNHNMPDGTTYDRAIVVNAKNTKDGIAEQYLYLENAYPCFSLTRQQLKFEGDKVYDVINFTDTHGISHQVHFDITSFFGKL